MHYQWLLWQIQTHENWHKNSYFMWLLGEPEGDSYYDIINA